MVGGEITLRPRRWSPTAEQLMVLQELYRRGLRNPNGFQVRTITCHLSLYGKVETKNVFYWFQNHKARDRQKLRKTLKQMRCFRQEPHSALSVEVQNCCRHLSPRISTFPHQGDGAEKTLNMGVPTSYDVGNSMTRMFDHDWMTLMRTGSSLPRWVDDRTPKTLQLFPLEADDIKGQSSTTSSPVSSCLLHT